MSTDTNNVRVRVRGRGRVRVRGVLLIFGLNEKDMFLTLGNSVSN